MAFPAVASNNSGNDTTGTSHTVNLPGSIASGDLLIVIFATDGSPTVTFPSGWDQAANNLFDTANGTAVRLVAKQRVADGTEGSTITVTTSATEWTAHSTLRITGWHGTTAAEGGTATGSSSTANPPNLDPANWATEDTLWIACSARDAGGADDDDNTAHPTNYTAIHNVLASTNAGGVNLTSSRRDNAVSAEDPGTYTGPTTEEWVAGTIAIRPAAAGVTVSPGTGQLTLDGFAPTVQTPRTVTPGVGVLTLDGFAPTINIGVNVAPGLGQLDLTGFAPTIQTPVTVTPGVGALTLDGFAPTVQTPVIVTAGLGVLTLDGFAPTVNIGVNIMVGLGQLDLIGFAPTVQLPVTVTTGLGQLDLSGFAPTIQTPRNVLVGVGLLTIDGFAPIVDVGGIILTAAGSGPYGATMTTASGGATPNNAAGAIVTSGAGDARLING